MRIIPCTCDPQGRLSRIPCKELLRFQGTLKSLHADQYAKLKASMEEKGFFVPVFIWAGHKYLLDGHQRLNVLEREGWEVEGGVPVVEVEATDEKDAAEKLLLILSTYGKVDPQGVYEFTEEHGISLVEFDLLDLPDFDFEAFSAGFYENLEEMGQGEESEKRKLGDPKRAIKPVLYAEEVHLFEEALRATGEKNRGKALIQICREYLRNEKTEGQYNVNFEDTFAS